MCLVATLASFAPSTPICLYYKYRGALGRCPTSATPSRNVRPSSWKLHPPTSSVLFVVDASHFSQFFCIKNEF